MKQKMEKTYQVFKSLKQFQFNVIQQIDTYKTKKSYAYLLDTERNDLVFLKTYNTEFDEIVIKFRNQNGRSQEIEDKVNLAWLIDRNK